LEGWRGWGGGSWGKLHKREKSRRDGRVEGLAQPLGRTKVCEGRGTAIQGRCYRKQNARRGKKWGRKKKPFYVGKWGENWGVGGGNKLQKPGWLGGGNIGKNRAKKRSGANKERKSGTGGGGGGGRTISSGGRIFWLRGGGERDGSRRSLGFRGGGKKWLCTERKRERRGGVDRT